MSKRFVRIIARCVAALFGVSLVGLAGGKLYLDATYFDGYDPAAPLNVEVAEERELPEGQWSKFYFDGFRGERVPAVLLRPAVATRPLPCVIFLHGIGDDKEFMRRHKLDEPFVKAGYAFVCFDQLMRGERKLKDKSKLAEAEAFRVRAAHTVGDTRRLVDYVMARTDIATNRIYLVGASYGALVGSTAAAFDQRIRAVGLIYGGGNIQKLLSAEMIRREMRGWGPLAKTIAWYFGSVFDPVNHVGRISPRPVLLQNGKADTLVAPAAARALHSATKEPKTILWYEGDHLGKTRDLDVELATRVLVDALKFLNGVDAEILAQGPSKASP